MYISEEFRKQQHVEREHVYILTVSNDGAELCGVVVPSCVYEAII